MECFTILKDPRVSLASVNHVTLERTVTPIDDSSIFAGMLMEYSIQEVLSTLNIHSTAFRFSILIPDQRNIVPFIRIQPYSGYRIHVMYLPRSLPLLSACRQYGLQDWMKKRHSLLNAHHFILAALILRHSFFVFIF